MGSEKNLVCSALPIGDLSVNGVLLDFKLVRQY